MAKSKEAFCDFVTLLYFSTVRTFGFSYFVKEEGRVCMSFCLLEEKLAVRKERWMHLCHRLHKKDGHCRVCPFDTFLLVKVPWLLVRKPPGQAQSFLNFMGDGDAILVVVSCLRTGAGPPE
ncbi:unnamed protein product [Durusdinium trenchii]|uniref:Uncharacterized protein n=1 Tax=Durusdinium trenchii TaxID=1381693 RepID=A0ABP0I1G0_9DINO